MKVLVTSQGPDATAEVDPRFGRARYYLVHDSDTGAYVALDNQEQLEAVQGAGVQAAQIAVSSGARIVLTGHCGPKAFAVLTAAGIQVYAGVSGQVQSALRAWQAGELSVLDQPDGIPHS